MERSTSCSIQELSDIIRGDTADVRLISEVESSDESDDRKTESLCSSFTRKAESNWGFADSVVRGPWRRKALNFWKPYPNPLSHFTFSLNLTR
ncbi:hypothetical protein LOK49_LG14G01771 [Camellia lanceoleosa]|uniref:Uncharacterized protein n=1 Tax=Camellia lanceoleosa TaxID=1840588 RepID=A0ACC0F8I3_9ERIC|nr:hypothetical protein LOK49_LG14G01771 [Camellia lanceoleosa]